jgi:hypothetical protein
MAENESQETRPRIPAPAGQPASEGRQKELLVDEEFRALLEASSLGTEAARRIRAMTSYDEVANLMPDDLKPG